MIDEKYIEEKVEVYNIAIEALRSHESCSDGDEKLKWKLRERLANKLDREINKWLRSISWE